MSHVPELHNAFYLIQCGDYPVGVEPRFTSFNVNSTTLEGEGALLRRSCDEVVESRGWSGCVKILCPSLLLLWRKLKS